MPLWVVHTERRGALSSARSGPFRKRGGVDQHRNGASPLMRPKLLDGNLRRKLLPNLRRSPPPKRLPTCYPVHGHVRAVAELQVATSIGYCPLCGITVIFGPPLSSDDLHQNVSKGADVTRSQA